MPKTDPYKADRKTQDKDRVDHFLGRKSGGRVKADDGTNIHIEINAAKPEQGATDAMPMLPPTAGPIPPPPMAPPMIPPPGPGGPMGGGGALGLKTGGAVKKTMGGPMMGRAMGQPTARLPGALMGRKSGGKAHKEPDADERGGASDSDSDDKARKRAAGGAARSYADMTAGAASGPGRQEKTSITKSQRP